MLMDIINQEILDWSEEGELSLVDLSGRIDAKFKDLLYSP